jgi:hypothetical protein
MSLGAYETIPSKGNIPDPDLAAVPPFQDLLRTGFRDQYVDRLDHAVIKHLHGN